MLNSKSRRLTIVLTAGALTVFGAAGAFAAEGDNPGGPGSGDGNNPLCAGSLAGTPLCAGGGGGGEEGAPPGDEQTPGDEAPGGGGSQPANEGGQNPLCTGTPVAAQSLPMCAPEDGKEKSPGGGGTQPSNEGDQNPLCTGTPVAAQSLPMCAPEDGEEKGPGTGGGAQPSDETNPACNTPLSATPICASPGQPPGEGGGGGGGDTQPSPGGPGGGGSGPSV
jgi:hypothetical protein